jgi:hypothetical protein
MTRTEDQCPLCAGEMFYEDTEGTLTACPNCHPNAHLIGGMPVQRAKQATTEHRETETAETLRARIVKALEPYDIPTGAWTEAERMEPALAVENALADWLDAINRRVEDSEAYRRGKNDGYRYAYDLFGPELESLRAKVSDFGRSVDQGEERRG